MNKEFSPGETIDGISNIASPSPAGHRRQAVSEDAALRERPQSSRSPVENEMRSQLQTSGLPDGFISANVMDGMSSWSANSDKQLGYGFAGRSDRVFPVRSVVSVDPTQPPVAGPRTSGESDGFPGMVGPVAAGQAIASPGQSPRMHTRSGSELASVSDRGARRSFESVTNFSVTGPPERKASVSGTPKERTMSTSTNHSDEDGQYGGGERMQIFNEATSTSEISTDRGTDNGTKKNGASYQDSTLATPNSAHHRTPGDRDFGGDLVTARFKHIVTQDGHAVITGRDGDVLQRCEDEPIHTPGAVQSFGLLVALKEEKEGQFVVRIVSENSKRIIGYSPGELFKLHSFLDIFSGEQSDNLLDHVDFIRDEEADPGTNGPEVFTISIRTPMKKAIKLWCAMHINPKAPDTIICEFELDDDQMYPIAPRSEETPEPPEDTLQSNPTDEEFTESTQNKSKPLRVLRSARKRKGEAAVMEVFNIMSQVQEQLASAPNLEVFLKILVGVVKELTGFHRVMIYQFDTSFNGRVVTELVDPRATKDLYKGLNFPASDIPKQARDLYKINKVRLLYDRDLETARLVCRAVEDLDNPLDLSFSYLRAMSPIHIKYLANMAVRSSMSISINAFDELWGLIACHSYGSKGMRVSFPIRKMCRLVGDTASRNIERLSYASRLQARKLINTIPTEANPSGYIIASSDDLLTLFDADFGLLSIRGETKILGKLEQSQEALAMLAYLRMRNITSVVTSQDVKIDFPDLRYGPGFEVIAGLLLVPLSVVGSDFIVFFRKGQVREVKWAGNPYEKFIKAGTEGYLEPRKSFKTWSETVIGKCREWTEEQVETAAVLCLVYGKFIEVWRQKEAALQSSQLTRLLLANSAHEVRTPLNAIINYLEIALEGTLDQDTRENLAKSHSASKSLIYVINDLLDLTKTEEGQELFKDELFDLSATVREATDVFNGDAKRKGLEYLVVENPGIPQFVLGDQRRVRQAVANVTANAMQHTTSGGVRVELLLAEHEGKRVAIDIVVEDTGCGMSNQKLDSLFRDLEQVSTDSDDELFKNQDSNDNQVASSAESRTLGLGLALVARIVRNMDGQLRLKSEEGQGSRFVIQLPFDLPDDVSSEIASLGAPQSSSPSLELSGHSSLSNLTEVVLVERTSSHRESLGLAYKRSIEQTTSIQSYKSGSSGNSGRSAKSDVDRLIDAISEPLSVGKPEAEQVRVASSNNKGSGGIRRSTASLGSNGNERVTRPGIGRAKSYGTAITPEHLPLSTESPAGGEFVTDNKTLLKAVRIPEEFTESSKEKAQPRTASRVLFNLPPSNNTEAHGQHNAENLQVLVAEDDPVNSKIIKKRLEKAGHVVHHTINGEECATAYGDKPAFFDVVLMDMQMPIVDGLTSTKMIRSHEKTTSGIELSTRAKANGRVPILAVSASLLERERQTYINAGFDGWILKPIDFKRLNTLLTGIVDEKVRKDCFYEPGEWERGGFFDCRQTTIGRAHTWHSEKSAVSESPQKSLGGTIQTKTQEADMGSSSERSVTGNRLPLIHDERLDSTNQESSMSTKPVEDGAAASTSK